MSGTAKKAQGKSTTESGKKGVAYDVCRKVKQVGGSEKLSPIGTVFIRRSGSGGVAFLSGVDGKRQELAIFARKPAAAA
jgi:hypothetical protein